MISKERRAPCLQASSMLQRRALVVMGASMLAGCSQQFNGAMSTAPGSVVPAPESASESGSASGSGEDSSAIRAAKVAFAYPLAGQADVVPLDFETHFGPQVKSTAVQVRPGSAAAHGILEDLAAQGNSIIFGTSGAYAKPMKEVAFQNPRARFELRGTYGDTLVPARNIRTYDIRTYEGAYLAGVIAGAMTKSGLIGFVASSPMPEVMRNINSFTLGAQSSNPQVKTKVLWVYNSDTPPMEFEAAAALIGHGADILLLTARSHATLRMANLSRVRAFGWDLDGAPAGPAHLGSIRLNWSPYYVRATEEAIHGTWRARHSWWGVKEGAIELTSVAADVPESVKSRLLVIEQGLKDGTFNVWKGPIVDQRGITRVAAASSADDHVLASMNFFVQGVDERARPMVVPQGFQFR